MAIRRPATITCRNPPVPGRARWYPCCVGMFGLEDEQGGHSCPGCTYTLNCSYPFLSATNLLPAWFLAYVDQCSCSLACTNCKTWLVHVVDSFGRVLVLEKHLGDSHLFIVSWLVALNRAPSIWRVHIPSISGRRAQKRSSQCLPIGGGGCRGLFESWMRARRISSAICITSAGDAGRHVSDV